MMKKIIGCLLLFQTLSAELTVSESTSIDEAISACFPQLQSEAFSAKRLNGGHSGDPKFLLRGEGKQYVLRLFQSNDSLKNQRILYAMLEGAKAGIAPQIHFVSKDNKTIIMDYIEGGTHSLEQSRNRENRELITAGLRKVHATEKNPYIQVNMQERAEEFYQQYYDRMVNKQDFTVAFHLLMQTFQELENLNPPHVNIHADLSPRNIFISNGHVFFIDWSPYWEDPFLDLTYFAVSHDFGDEEEKSLLEDYLQRSPTLEEKKRFQLAKKIVLSRLCMSLNMLVSDEEGIDVSAPLKEYSHYIRLLTSPDVELTSQYFYEVSQILLQKAKMAD